MASLKRVLSIHHINEKMQDILDYDNRLRYNMVGRLTNALHDIGCTNVVGFYDAGKGKYAIHVTFENSLVRDECIFFKTYERDDVYNEMKLKDFIYNHPELNNMDCITSIDLIDYHQELFDVHVHLNHEVM